jgi:asparagine synthase (glutamine-hydrolysing)
MDTVQRRLGAEPEWMLVHGRPGFAIALEHPHPLEIRPLGDGSGWVIGDLYQKADFRPAPDVLGEIRQDSFPGRRLIEDFWGRYVAIWRTPAGLEILRDPSGALDAVRWRANSVDLTASGLPPTWIGDLAPRTSIDWDIFAGQLVEPILASETVALKGITSVPAGAHFVQSHNGGAYQRIWAPATIVRSSAPTPFEGAAEQLEALVDDCIGAMARNRGRVAAELSGGLDSSILSAALCEVPNVGFAGCVNFFGRDLESDERAAARLVSSQLGIGLTEIAKPELVFTEKSLSFQPVGIRPSQSALDHVYDLAIIQFCAEQGALTLMTGQGGDAVFLQMTTPLALLDAHCHSGRVQEALAIARETRRSIWRVGSEALAAAFGFARRSSTRTPSFLTLEAVEAAKRQTHPWLMDLGGLPLAKRAHIRALAYAQVAHGESRRGRAVDVVHPLLAQPIVEYCLATPVIDLTAGGRGRSLARRAYETRLPRATIERRTKGDMTSHYGRAIARSSSVLQSFLLDGRLARTGFIDRPKLEAALAPEALIWRGDYVDILHLMVMEIWARYWTTDAPRSHLHASR